MNWRSNVCKQIPHNCRKGDKCQDTEECCFERDTPSGHKGNQGTCVAKGSCNFKTGIPTNLAKIPCSSQDYTEGYDDTKVKSCTDWKWVAFILLIIMVIMSVGIVYMGLKCRKV
jgi:hypothetical protein